MVYMYQVYYFPVARSGYSSNIIAGLLFLSGEVWIFVNYHCSFIISQWRGMDIRHQSLGTEPLVKSAKLDNVLLVTKTTEI